MKNNTNTPIVERKKVISIMLLLITSVLIVVLGISFSIISLVNNVSFTVFGSQIHGAVFGLVIAFLGVRYFLSVRKLKAEVYKTTSRFSWNNFKKDKTCKSLSKNR